MCQGWVTGELSRQVTASGNIKRLRAKSKEASFEMPLHRDNAHAKETFLSVSVSQRPYVLLPEPVKMHVKQNVCYVEQALAWCMVDNSGHT